MTADSAVTAAASDVRGTPEVPDVPDASHELAMPDELSAFDLGVEAGRDPRQVVATIDTDGTAVTSPSSWWNRRQCMTCWHTFRRGDVVRVDPLARTVVHLEPGLRCGATSGDAGGTTTIDAGGNPDGKPVGVPVGIPDQVADVADVSDFADGLLSAWPAGEGVPVYRLGPGDWRIPRPGQASLGCLYCGHTFRAGEHVVVCPCQPTNAACRRAVHRDPAAGLVCWESWRPDGRLDVCPVTLTRVRR